MHQLVMLRVELATVSSVVVVLSAYDDFLISVSVLKSHER